MTDTSVLKDEREGSVRKSRVCRAGANLIIRDSKGFVPERRSGASPSFMPLMLQ